MGILVRTKPNWEDATSSDITIELPKKQRPKTRTPTADSSKDRTPLTKSRKLRTSRAVPYLPEEEPTLSCLPPFTPLF